MMEEKKSDNWLKSTFKISMLGRELEIFFRINNAYNQFQDYLA